LVTVPGLINLDLADVRTIMTSAGTAHMGIGTGRGEQRAQKAADMAINSSLLETSIDGARGILLNISGGDDLSLFEVHEVAEIVNQAADPEANIIFGAVVDETLGDLIRVTVVAAGFENRPRPRQERPAEVVTSSEAGGETGESSESGAAEPAAEGGAGEEAEPGSSEDLEIPDFLRGFER
jgi:cell division protein FtsZ